MSKEMRAPEWASQRLANAFQRQHGRRPTEAELTSVEYLYLERTRHRRPMTAMGSTLALMRRMSQHELLAEGRSAIARANRQPFVRLPLDPELAWDGYLLTTAISQDKAVLRAVRRHGDRLYAFPGRGQPNGYWTTATEEQVVLVEDLSEAEIPDAPRSILLPYSHQALRKLAPWSDLPDHGPID